MRVLMQLSCAALLCSAAACAGSHGDDPSAADAALSVEALRERALASMAAIDDARWPTDAAAKARAELGRSLFFAESLSTTGLVSCGTCHQTQYGGGDGLPRARGVFGRSTPRNAPSIFNVGAEKLWHWRADRETLAIAATGSFLNEQLFGHKEAADVLALARASGFQASIERAYPDARPAFSLDNIADAIASYEVTLLTPAPFDKFLRGEDAALGGPELAGLRMFVTLGCADCHSGQDIGGDLLREFGVHRPYAELTHSDRVDPGRFDVTHDETDRFVFKVAPLRNVAESGPYFHDGSVDTLEDAVRIMAEAQLDVTLSPQQVADLVSFLGALSGPAPEWFGTP
jgi:cytochrome c peroxidase